jgi:DNA-binding response OmpR family regulator
VLFRFAELELDEARHQLSRAGEPITVQPKSLELLLLLLRRLGIIDVQARAER